MRFAGLYLCLALAVMGCSGSVRGSASLGDPNRADASLPGDGQSGGTAGQPSTGSGGTAGRPPNATGGTPGQPPTATGGVDGQPSTGATGGTQPPPGAGGTDGPAAPTAFSYQARFARHLGGSHYDGIRDVTFTADHGMVLVGGTFVVPGDGSHDFGFAAAPTNNYKNTNCNTSSGGDDMDAVVVRLDEAGAVQWITFVGGPHYERAYAVEVAPDGDIVIAGRSGPCTPTTAGVAQERFAGDTAANAYGMQDGFVTRLRPDGTMRWSTFLGGSDSGFIRDMALDAAGNVVVATSAGADASFGEWAGGDGTPWKADAFAAGAFQTGRTGGQDVIVAKIAADGSKILWASRLGGTFDDGSQPSVRVGPDDGVVMLTHGMSSDFNQDTQPIYGGYTVGPADMRVNHGNLVKLTGSGKHVFTRYLGGQGPVEGDTHNLWVDRAGLIYVGDSFCADNQGCYQIKSDSSDPPQDLSNVDPAPDGLQTRYAGGGILANNWISGNYPGDGYIVKLTGDGATVLGSTFFGGRWGEGIEGIAVTDDGTVVVSGGTMSSDNPAPAQGAVGQFQGSLDGFVAVLSSDLKEVLYLRYLGGPGDNAALSVATDGGRIILSGSTGPVATLHHSPDGNSAQPASLLTGLGDTPVLPNIGVTGDVDAFIYVFEQTPLPAP